MPDPDDQKITNPQALVDEALSGDQAPVATPTPPEPALPVLEPLKAEEPKVAMGDETPLAFVAPAPPVQESSYLPPVPPAPINTNIAKPKKKMGIVLGGILMLVVALGSGVWGYAKYNTQKNQVAIVTGCRSVCEGSKKDEEACEACALGQMIKEDKPNTIDGDKLAEDIADKVGRQLENDEDAVNRNIAVKALEIDIGDSCPANAPGGTQCAQGKGVCYNGKCTAIGTCLPGDSCPMSCTGQNTSGWTPVKEPGGGKYCDDDGRECSYYRNELRDGPTGGTHCFVGYGEQCGEPGQCGPGTNIKSPSPKPSTPALVPSPSPSPTMACTGLTQTPSTAPVVGSKLTFTCSGKVTPANAGNLSYNFRYAINNGSWTNLTNKTTTTSELTISACGTYKVECRACATIGGLVQCDPFWQYAGVQPL